MKTFTKQLIINYSEKNDKGKQSHFYAVSPVAKSNQVDNKRKVLIKDSGYHHVTTPNKI